MARLESSSTRIRRTGTVIAILALTAGVALSNSASAQAATAAQPRVVAPTCFSRDLARGSRGDDVALLQIGLNYLNLRRGRIDGIFGSGTRTAWKRWERIIGARADGVASLGELSWGACARPEPVAAPVADPISADTAVVQQTTPPPVAATAVSPTATPTTAADSVTIDSIGLTRPIIVGYASQATIDSCQGAVLYDGGWPGTGTGMYLAAHRTSCGTLGFNGIQNLPAGALVSIHHQGATTQFAVQSVAVATAGDPLRTPGAGVLVLQTSKTGNAVWVVTATQVG